MSLLAEACELFNRDVDFEIEYRLSYKLEVPTPGRELSIKPQSSHGNALVTCEMVTCAMKYQLKSVSVANPKYEQAVICHLGLPTGVSGSTGDFLEISQFRPDFLLTEKTLKERCCTSDCHPATSNCRAAPGDQRRRIPELRRRLPGSLRDLSVTISRRVPKKKKF